MTNPQRPPATWHPVAVLAIVCATVVAIVWIITG